jgi:hypothetical protein
VLPNDASAGSQHRERVVARKPLGFGDAVLHRLCLLSIGGPTGRSNLACDTVIGWWAGEVSETVYDSGGAAYGALDNYGLGP